MSFGSIDGYEIDAFTVEEHKRTSEVTSYPVESGGDITDHVNRKPRTFSCTGVVSDTPLGAMVAIRAAQGLVADLTGAFGGSDRQLPSQEARARFEKIYENRLPVVVICSIGRLENMVMEDITFSVDIETGAAFRFKAAFKQIRKVTNERTTVRVAVPSAAKAVNRGNKPAKEAAPAPKTFTRVKAYKDSWGGQIAQGLGALDGFGSGTKDVED